MTAHPPVSRLRSVRTRSISPENFDGSAGGGGRATEGTGASCARDLGTGWKISPSVDIPPHVYYQLTYELDGDYADEGYFQAQWRRSNPLEYLRTHVLLDDVLGSGHYVGTYLAWGVNSNGWWARAR